MDRTQFLRVREALMIHFTESPASRHKDRVEVIGRGGFRLVVHFDSLDWRVEVQGTATDDQVARLARADDLLMNRLRPRVRAVDPRLAGRMELAETAGERHPWRPPFRGHHYE